VSTVASEYEADWGDDIRVLSTNINQAKDCFKSMVSSAVRACAPGSDDLVFVLSGQGNFRQDLDPSYKSNRKGVRKPLGYHTMVEWIAQEYAGRVVSKDGLEADDYLGILATKPGSVERIIVSDDKDLQTIPGKLYRLGEFSERDEDEANRFWFTQALTGDPTDGYKGCPGIGPVKAKALVNKSGDTWEHVKAAFLKAGMSEEDALLQCRLSRILRFTDWDTKKQQVRLWTPSN